VPKGDAAGYEIKDKTASAERDKTMMPQSPNPVQAALDARFAGRRASIEAAEAAQAAAIVETPSPDPKLLMPPAATAAKKDVTE